MAAREELFQTAVERPMRSKYLATVEREWAVAKARAAPAVVDTARALRGLRRRLR